MSKEQEATMNEKHVFHLIGKSGRYKVTGAIEVRLKEKNSCAPHLDIDLQPCARYIEFTSGVGIKGRCYGESWGRITPELTEMFPSCASSLRKLAAFSSRWHLNGLQAGTRRQRAFLKQHPEINARCDYYAAACDLLKDAGLYACGSYVKYPDGRNCPSCKGAGVVGGIYPMPCLTCKTTGWEQPFSQLYRYGEAWLSEPLPVSALAELRMILAELKEAQDG